MPNPRAPATEEASKAGQILGSRRTLKKEASSRRNILAAKAKGLVGGRPKKALSEFVCICAAPDALEGHRWDCLRGQAIKRRRKAETL